MENTAQTFAHQNTQYRYNMATLFWFKGFILGLLAFAIPFLSDPPGDMKQDAWHVAGMMLMMAFWWGFEIIPLAVTALIPIVLLPLLNIMPVNNVLHSYAHPIVFLFLGGFALGVAIEKCNLHKRIALHIIAMFGVHPKRIIAGFMCATAFFSMWISNTATAIMMLPMALSVVYLMESNYENKEEARPFAIAILLSVAYAASIGGVSTIIGTPPNGILAGYLRETHQIDISISDWMIIGIPISLAMLAATWAWLTLPLKNLKIDGEKLQSIFQEHRSELGILSRAELLVAIVFFFTAASWILRKQINAIFQLNLTDTIIAISAMIVLFLTPVNLRKKEFLMDWNSAKRIPWDALLLFGGGLALAGGIKFSGLAVWIAQILENFENISTLVVILFSVFIIIFLTELNSNTATAATFIPLLGITALTFNIDLLYLLVPTTIAASFAFMMPVATPPNTIVYGAGYLTIRDMMVKGLVLNIIGIAIVITITYFLTQKLSLFEFPVPAL